MAQARALNLDGTLLREFGFAALMHDIGKVNTPLEVLNKPDKLTKEEFDIMKRHVVDGAHILRRTPEMPALAPIVAFEHHLKQDLSGYPEKIGSRKLNLCTMIVSIADVFDALRSTRPYRKGLATDRIRNIMGEQTNPAFNQVLLKRFVNLMGLFPVGNLVRLNTDELAVVTAEHPSDPFRPQVKIISDSKGDMLEEPLLTNTWERDSRGESSPRRRRGRRSRAAWHRSAHVFVRHTTRRSHVGADGYEPLAPEDTARLIELRARLQGRGARRAAVSGRASGDRSHARTNRAGHVRRGASSAAEVDRAPGHRPP